MIRIASRTAISLLWASTLVVLSGRSVLPCPTHSEVAASDAHGAMAAPTGHAADDEAPDHGSEGHAQCLCAGMCLTCCAVAVDAVVGPAHAPPGPVTARVASRAVAEHVDPNAHLRPWAQPPPA